MKQPGSLRLVQFQESDGIDFDAAPRFALPESSEPADAPTPSNRFDTAVPEVAEEDTTSDPLFDTPPTEQGDLPEPAVTNRPPALNFDETPELLNNENSAPDAVRETPPAGSPFSKSGAELQAEIEEALRENPTLPNLDGAFDAPQPSTKNQVPQSPLGPDDDEASSDVDQDLAHTNGQDCSTSQQDCEDELQFLRRRERTDMSLDITPSIEPREFDMAKVDEVKNEKLSQAPSRTWRDRQGREIADGKLEDFRYGKVVIRTVNGTQRMIPKHELSNQDRCFVNAWWELPDECHFEDEPFVMRDYRMSTFTWTAAATCHKPLYFEEVGLERYGHTAGPLLQPVASGAHFFGSILLMPYQMGLTPPNECVYPLGHYRPGDCAPWIIRGFPMTTRGFRWEAAALGAGIALLP